MDKSEELGKRLHAIILQACATVTSWVVAPTIPMKVTSYTECGHFSHNADQLLGTTIVPAAQAAGRYFCRGYIL